MNEKDILKQWKRDSIIIGTPTNILAALTAFIPVIWLCTTYDCWPPLGTVLTAWGMVAASFGAFYFVEPISYYAALGLSGTYLSFLSGNIGNMRVPCAALALDVTDSTPGTIQAEVVSTMAICGSIITNLIGTTSAVIVGSAVLSVLPERMDPEALAARLASDGVALRAGLHCAPLAHMTAGTLETGTLRFSASVFNTMDEVEQVLRLLQS